MRAETATRLRVAGNSARHSDFSDPVFASPREFLGNHFVYAVVSPRGRGLSIGVNMNPDKRCNFNCAYCEVNHAAPPSKKTIDVKLMADELQRTLWLARSGGLGDFSWQHQKSDIQPQLRQVALSGNGEPTLCPNFFDVLRTLVHVRALGRFPFFKIVLITNASRLDLQQVQDGLKLFTLQDEIWAKMDAGTQRYMDKVNKPGCTLEKILENILFVARQRPVIIQSLFPLLDGAKPPEREIMQYARRLKELRLAGAQIPLVQIYSSTPSSAQSRCAHLPLALLAHIARRVREISGLNAEVF
jgi:wyosine [tRNA(Phe)-imidazoG37] synthetase (radical SAM superfamily)